MTFLVPYDGTALSAAALTRSTTYGAVNEQAVVAVSVIPSDPRYAAAKGWIRTPTAFDRKQVVAQLEASVEQIAPTATFRYVLTERFPQPGTIVTKIRRVAEHVGAEVIFIGSDNAGRMVSSITSIGSGVASSKRYDVHIVRHPLEETPPIWQY